MPWVVGEDEQSQRNLASTGIALIKAAHDGNKDEIESQNLVKELFGSS
jgi:hypothetical protein